MRCPLVPLLRGDQLRLERVRSRWRHRILISEAERREGSANGFCQCDASATTERDALNGVSLPRARLSAFIKCKSFVFF